MSDERKLDEIYKMVMEMHGDLKVYKVVLDDHREHIIKNALKIDELEKVQHVIIADKNKILGAAWLGAILGTTGIGAFLLQLFKHN